MKKHYIEIMVKKRNLSRKKSERLTISISPYLKDWIERYVKEQNDKYPNDDRYKSISRFTTSLLEKNLKLFQKGKSLDDFEKKPDRKTLEFYDTLTFRAYIDVFEESIDKNKYTIIDFESYAKISQLFKKTMFKKEIQNREERFVNAINRMKKFMFSNNVTTGFRIEYKNDKFYLEMDGTRPNIQHINNKGIIGVFSFLGLKLNDIITSKLHTRFEFSKSYLFNKDDLLSKERKNLYQENIKKIINFNEIIKDQIHHFWIKAATLSDTFISFYNYDSGIRILTEIINEIMKYSKRNNLQILKLFEKLKWITLVKGYEDSVFFILNLKGDDYNLEKKLLFDTLTKFGKIKHKKDKFFFV